MFSRVRNAMKLSFFYDHNNYLKMAAIWVKILNTYSRGVILLWELQFDVSIILLVNFLCNLNLQLGKMIYLNVA